VVVESGGRICYLIEDMQIGGGGGELPFLNMSVRSPSRDVNLSSISDCKSSNCVPSTMMRTYLSKSSISGNPKRC